MSEDYPFQLEQDFVDEYLEIPKDRRPPFDRWAQVQMEGMAAMLVPVWEKELKPVWEKILKWQQLTELMMANDKAAAKRRRRGYKSSMQVL